MIIRSLWALPTVLQLSDAGVLVKVFFTIPFAFVILVVILAIISEPADKKPQLKDSDKLQDLEYTALANPDFLEELRPAVMENFEKEHVYWQKESETELVCKRQHTDTEIGRVQIDTDGVITTQFRNGEDVLRDICQVDTNEPDMELRQAASTTYDKLRGRWDYITE